MNARFKRASFLITTVALAAVAVVTATTPASAAKPAGKGKRTTFTIEVTIIGNVWGFVPHGFKARGAISDSGPVSLFSSDEMYPFTLVGRRGSMDVDVVGDVFVILDATGDYVEFINLTGAASRSVEWSRPPKKDPWGSSYPIYTVTLEGSIVP